MDPASLALLSTSALAVGAYLNAKLSVGTDLRQLRDDRDWLNRLVSRVQSSGHTCTLYSMFELVRPDREFLWFEGRTWTYGELKTDVDRLALYLRGHGVGPDDFVGIFMSNSPEMVITILALTKLGAIAALINTNLRSDTLKHCLELSTCRIILSTPDLAEFVVGSLQHFCLSLHAFSKAPSVEGLSITPIGVVELSNTQGTLQPARRSPKNLAVLVYTSGTTGKPKACGIRNMQLYVVSNPLSLDIDNPSTYLPLRTYSALPLFHGTCLFTGLSYSIGMGATFCLARKFSSSRFWKDVSDCGATRVLYVGELCRYLLSSPPSPYDRKHQCIVANGNGLRGDIWEKFKERFGIPEIREFYRSTEGVAKYDNFSFSSLAAGKVGFSGPLRRYLETDTFIIRVDSETGEPYRDPKTGFCARAKLGEAGEAVGRVKDRALLTEYLHNDSATEEKLIRDVFSKGDIYHRMGDLLLQDSEGWVHFHDRVGDTFRWKGENVSTGEVRDHIAKLPGVEDAVVYGVKLASYDGKAGAAAITLNGISETSFVASLNKELKKKGLPSYAIPRFVRITQEIGTGISFKQAKGEIAKKGWTENEGGDTDRLYWLNGAVYDRLDSESWKTVQEGRAKL